MVDHIEFLSTTMREAEKVIQMHNNYKTKEQITEELSELRLHIAELEAEVSEQKKTANALRENEDNLLHIFNINPLPTFVIDQSHTVTQWNKACEELTSIPATEILGTKNTWSAFYNEERPVLADLIVDGATEKEITELYGSGFNKSGTIEDAYETEGYSANIGGKEKWIFIISAPIKNPQGKIIGAIETLQDITKRIKAEGQLRKSETRYRTILETIEDGYFESDLTGNLTFFNDSVCRIFGYSRDELTGMNYKKRMNGDTAKSVFKIFNTVYQTGTPSKNAEWTANRKDGNKVNIEVSISLIKDEQSQPIGFRGIMRDISDRKKVERELKKSNAELSQLLAELQQTHAQMLQSEKMASIGQLAAGVAHEINNPTGFVNSNLNTLSEYHDNIIELIRLYRNLIIDLKEGMQDELLSPSILEQIKNISELEAEADIDFILEDASDLIKDCIEGTERIKKIVLDLKDFAHPGEEKMIASDINKGIESTLNVVWNELKYKASVIKDLRDIPLVECYPQQLNQVFMNILVNAANAIEDQGEITVSTASYNGYVEIKISDTGIGIPKENLSRIFDPFFTTKDVGKGTGLGLNVAYNIIKKHRGTINIESEPGKGTTFTIRIPVHSGIKDELRHRS